MRTKGTLCETLLNQFQPFQLQPVSVNVGMVVLRLLDKPAFGAAAWLTVRKKQADRTWKIVRDVSISDLPLRNPGK